MAHTDKNIVITPHSGNTTNDPRIAFSGANASVTAQTVTLFAYPTESGTISIEGAPGQLFSVTNNLKGTIFSVNDISGIPSIEVLESGLVELAQYSGNVLIGTGVSKNDALHVNGAISTNARNPIKFYDTDSSHFVAFRANTTVAANITWNLPNADGTSGQVLFTDGAANLSWGGSLVTQFVTDIGDGVNTSITVTHSLNKSNVTVTVRENSTNYYVYPDIKYSTSNAIILEFVDAPTSAQYRVIVFGIN